MTAADAEVAAGHAILVRDLTVAFDRQPAVHHLTGTFPAGSLTAILGPNGAGKSTLLKTIVGLLRPVEGEVVLSPPGDIAYLPQQIEVDRNFPISVLDAVLFGFWRRIGWSRGVTAAMRREAEAALAAVGLGGFERRSVGSLSVGQFQRALFARIIVQDAPVILLDEPFAAVDSATISDLLAIIAGWHAQGRTVLAVLHDLHQVEGHFPEALLLARECIAWGPVETVLTRDNLRRVRQVLDPWATDAMLARSHS